MPETQNHSLIKNVSHWLKSIAILYLFDSSSISLYLLKVQCIYLHCVTVQAVHHKLPPFHFEKCVYVKIGFEIQDYKWLFICFTIHTNFYRATKNNCDA